MVERPSRRRALRAARIGIFAALYALTGLIPISIFIGAASFLALNLIMTPAVAILLPPTEALIAGLMGGVIAVYVAPFQAMFGPLTFLLPLVGATLGSLAYHRSRWGSLPAVIWLLSAAVGYLVKNGGFPFFVVPHCIAATVAASLFFGTPLWLKVPASAFVSTMCEQGMMMFFAVYLLELPGQAFIGILPLMVYERVVATVGGAFISMGLLKAVPQYLQQMA